MEKILIVCASKNGSTKMYCDWLASCLGAEVIDYKKVKARIIDGYDQIIYGGAVRINRILGFKNFFEKFKIDKNKIIVFGVGMNVKTTEYTNILKKSNVDVNSDKFFYMQGIFNLQTLKSKTERTILRRVCHALMLRSDLSDAEKYIVFVSINPQDGMDKNNLLPIIELINPDMSDKLKDITYESTLNSSETTITEKQ